MKSKFYIKKCSESHSLLKSSQKTYFSSLDSQIIFSSRVSAAASLGFSIYKTNNTQFYDSSNAVTM